MKIRKICCISSIAFAMVGLVLSVQPKNALRVSAAPTEKQTIYLQAADVEMTWGIWKYGDGVAGFRAGNTSEGSDTLKSFDVPEEGNYKVVFNYYAGAFTDATADKRILNFVVNGRRNIVKLTKDPNGDWGVPYSEEFTLYLDKGANSIMLQGEHGPDSCVNADNLQVFDSTDNLIVKLEAEEGTFNNTGIPAAGIVAGFQNRNRPSADIKVNVAKAGLYTLGFEYAAGEDAGNADPIRYLNVGANLQGKVDSSLRVEFPFTGDWGVYMTNSFNLELNAGNNIITVTGTDALGSSINLRNLYVALSGYQQALDFANEYLFMDTVPTTDKSETAQCATNYADAKSAFAALTDEALESFLGDDDFADARERLAAWATANSETFDPSDGSFSSVSFFNYTRNTSDMTVAVLIIVASISISIICSTLFLKKKNK